MIPDLDQSQNLIDWSLATCLSFHKIWFKSLSSCSHPCPSVTKQYNLVPAKSGDALRLER